MPIVFGADHNPVAMARQIGQVLNETRGSVVCESTEMADNTWTRLRGLLGRDGLGAGHGMIIRPAGSIHSAFMRFRFDAVFLDRHMVVVGLAEDVPPWRIRGARRAKSTLELAAGEIGRRGLQVGDALAVK